MRARGAAGTSKLSSLWDEEGITPKVRTEIEKSQANGTAKSVPFACDFILLISTRKIEHPIIKTKDSG